jgi:cation diffusion facilitator family transporter
MRFRPQKTRILLLSVAAAVITMAMKFTAYWITNSVGLLSDAAESIINLAAALVAFVALLIAAKPADETHPYGHEKIEYFSSGVEGTLILFAAAGIIYSSVERFLHPQALNDLDLGLMIGFGASLINFAVARILLVSAKRHDSITLEADARHLMTDVWTSVGVIIGLVVVRQSGMLILDPLIALLAGANIVFSGIHLLKRSFRGLMDYRLPAAEMALLEDILQKHIGAHHAYHNLRTRKAGSQRFIEFHLLVPGDMLVKAAHDLSEQIENDIREQLANTTVTLHIEPEEELASYQDVQEGLRYGKP